MKSCFGMSQRRILFNVLFFKLTNAPATFQRRIGRWTISPGAEATCYLGHQLELVKSVLIPDWECGHC